MEVLTAGWHDAVKSLVDLRAGKKTRLWSFEVKRRLNRSNMREAHFQAVSNSSWANFGYLAAGEIQGDTTMEELRTLSALHGIGLIRIDTRNQSESESEIIIPACERPDVDWMTCNRLAEENAGFRDYLAKIKEFYQTGNPRPKDWGISLDRFDKVTGNSPV